MMARLALLFICWFAVAAPLAAQDAIPETPPELRDFRLDPERAPPRAEPQPTAPAPSPAQPPERAQAEPATPAPAQRQPQPDTRAQPDLPSASTPSPSARGSETGVSPGTETPILPDLLESQEGPSAIEAPAMQSGKSADARQVAIGLPWWQIGLVLAVLALLLIFIWRRKRSAKQVHAPIAETRPGTSPIRQPDLPRPPTPAPAAKRQPMPRPRMAISFVPEKATLSFASLTVKGQLRLINEGDALARNMKLRATLISADKGQERLIAAFHSGQLSIPEETLGDVAGRERIAMTIEMTMPLADLKSFEVGKHRIMVPVMIANLGYDWDGGSDRAEFACIVGREAQPPAPKMAPFRLDTGPRSFAPLGQRPLYA